MGGGMGWRGVQGGGVGRRGRGQPCPQAAAAPSAPPPCCCWPLVLVAGQLEPGLLVQMKSFSGHMYTLLPYF